MDVSAATEKISGSSSAESRTRTRKLTPAARRPGSTSVLGLGGLLPKRNRTLSCVPSPIPENAVVDTPGILYVAPKCSCHIPGARCLAHLDRNANSSPGDDNQSAHGKERRHSSGPARKLHWVYIPRLTDPQTFANPPPYHAANYSASAGSTQASHGPPIKDVVPQLSLENKVLPVDAPDRISAGVDPAAGSFRLPARTAPVSTAVVETGRSAPASNIILPNLFAAPRLSVGSIRPSHGLTLSDSTGVYRDVADRNPVRNNVLQCVGQLEDEHGPTATYARQKHVPDHVASKRLSCDFIHSRDLANLSILCGNIEPLPHVVPADIERDIYCITGPPGSLRRPTLHSVSLDRGPARSATSLERATSFTSSSESTLVVDHAMNLVENCLLTSTNAQQIGVSDTDINLPFSHLSYPYPSSVTGIAGVGGQSQHPYQDEITEMLERKPSEMSRRRVSASDAMTGDLTFKQQFLSMFQPSADNKLALKLFGSVAAVTKERDRIVESKHWIIHPASNFRFYFDLFMLVILLANLMVLPVSIAFFNDDFSLPWITFNCFSDTIFIIDLVCNFRTGLINPENAAVVILDPKEIARRYVRSWFFVDLISSIPFDYVVLVISIWDDDFAKSQIVHAGRALRILRMAKLLSLIKLLRLSRLVRYVSQFEEVYFLNIAGVFMRIFNFMCLMMLMAHWSGCIQFLVPMLQGFPRDSWVVINELEHSGWFEQYTWSFFKAISHQLSIGYGRYPPQSVSDAWLTVLSMLTGAFTYALFIGHASNLIHSLDASRRQYREKWKQVEEYMVYRKLPRQLRAKISDFYEHRFQGKIFDEDAILLELNDPLRELIINYNCRDLVSSVPFFSHADPNFVTAVITRLKYEFFLPDDVIVREGTLGDKMYFIQEGLVEIYLEPKLIHEEPAVITCLGDGSYFGEICLLTKAKRVASVRAVSCCSLFSLQSDCFTAVLNEYPLMRTALETVAAERLNKIGRDPTIIAQTSKDNLQKEYGGSDDIRSDTSRPHSPFPFQYPYSFHEEGEPGDTLTPHTPLLTAEALNSRLAASTQHYRSGAPHSPFMPPPSPRTLSPSNTYSQIPGSKSSNHLTAGPYPAYDSNSRRPSSGMGGLIMRPIDPPSPCPPELVVREKQVSRTKSTENPTLTVSQVHAPAGHDPSPRGPSFASSKNSAFSSVPSRNNVLDTNVVIDVNGQKAAESYRMASGPSLTGESVQMNQVGRVVDGKEGSRLDTSV